MQIDFNQKLYELDGREATTGGRRCAMCNSLVGGEEESLTLRIVASRAVIAEPQNRETAPSKMSKPERALLALKIFDSEKPLELESEQISALKAHIEALYPAITVAQAVELLEGRPNPFKR